MCKYVCIHLYIYIHVLSLQLMLLTNVFINDCVYTAFQMLFRHCVYGNMYHATVLYILIRYINLIILSFHQCVFIKETVTPHDKQNTLSLMCRHNQALQTQHWRASHNEHLPFTYALILPQYIQFATRTKVSFASYVTSKNMWATYHFCRSHLVGDRLWTLRLNSALSGGIPYPTKV